MSKKKSNNFILQGSILAIAGIIVRLIGLLYRVPLTNIIGESGMGVYATAYNVYNILLLISSYSLPVAVSRLVAANLSAGRFKNSRRLFFSALLFAAYSGGLMFFVTLFGAQYFAEMMKMPQAALAIKTLAPTILIMAFLGVFRGFFQGHNTMVPTAVSQILEQVINAIVSLLAGYYLFRSGAALDAASGLTDYYASAYGAAGGTIGTGAGALTAMLFTFLLYRAYRPRMQRRCAKDRSGYLDSSFDTMRFLLLTIIPILFSATVYQISTIVDQAIYAKYIGGDYEAIWGAYSGKYTLLIHVPTAIAAAIGSSIIPSLAAAIQNRRRAEAVSKAGMAIRFNMVIAIPAAVGLCVLAKPVMNLLFNGNNDMASHMMLIGSALIVVNAYSTITNSILQGIGNIWIPVRNSLIALVLHIGILILFLWGFDLGIDGVIYGNILFYVLMCLLNCLSMGKILNYRQEFLKTFVSPLASSLIMGAAALFGYKLLCKWLSSGLSCLIMILVSVFLYLILLLLTKGIDEADLSHMPKGRTLIRIFSKLHLLR